MGGRVVGCRSADYDAYKSLRLEGWCGLSESAFIDSHARTAEATGRRRVLRAVYERAEFNALLDRLPRSARRCEEPAPSGHLGLVVQIVSADDCALATVREHVPAGCDVPRALARLEGKAHEQLR